MASNELISQDPASRFDAYTVASSLQEGTGVPDFVYDHPVLSTLAGVGALAAAPAGAGLAALGALGAYSVVSPNFRNTAIATAADLGSTVWNSLPLTENTSTEAVLHGLNDDALSMYRDNPDKIHALSMLSGTFVSGAAAFKGMSLLRDGAKGINWFTNSGRAATLAKVESAIADAPVATSLYNKIGRAHV